jgi:hypothetical protein
MKMSKPVRFDGAWVVLVPLLAPSFSRNSAPFEHLFRAISVHTWLLWLLPPLLF